MNEAAAAVRDMMVFPRPVRVQGKYQLLPIFLAHHIVMVVDKVMMATLVPFA
jgi:hypothetical protein